MPVSTRFSSALTPIALSCSWMTMAAALRKEYSDHDVIVVSKPSGKPASARSALAPSTSTAGISTGSAAQ